MSIITYPLDGPTYSASDAETYLCTRTSGVYSAEDNFAVSITGDRQIAIGPGLAWIRNADHCGKSVCNTEAVPVDIPIADGTRPRIDRIVLRFDAAANASSIVLKQGTPSSTPSAPEVQQTELLYELGLYMINVPAASTVVTASHITNTMMDETVCGLMRDGVTGIPTAQLQEQVYSLLEDLQAVIAGVENGSEMMLKTIYDPDGKSEQVFTISGGTINGDVSVEGTIHADEAIINGAKAFTSRSNFSGNMNSTEIPPGIYFCNLSQCTGSPATSGYGWLIVYPNSRVQNFVFYSTHITYTRGYSNDQWYPWACTGGTDGVVASGTSGGWNYIKYANGNAICARTVDFTGAYIGAAVGNLYRSGGDVIASTSYPFSFTGPPSEVVSLRAGAKYVWPIGTTHNSMTSSGGYTLVSPVAYNSADTVVTGRASQIVIGRWK